MSKYNTGMHEHPDELAIMVLSRLERLSVDSRWAHRASGLRRTLLRTLEAYEDNITPASRDELQRVIEHGFYIIENAAREMGDRPNGRPIS